MNRQTCKSYSQIKRKTKTHKVYTDQQVKQIREYMNKNDSYLR